MKAGGPRRAAWPSWAAMYCAAHQQPKTRQAARTTRSVRLAPGAAWRAVCVSWGADIGLTPAGR
jgi:hypothetical protein